MAQTLVLDLPAIDRVGQHLVELSARETLGAIGPPRLCRARWNWLATALEFNRHLPNGAQLQVERENQPDDLGLGPFDHQRPFVRTEPERDKPTHPEPLLLRRGDLVADPLAGDFALELRKREQDVQRQAAHRGGRVERLRDRHEGDAVAIEDLDNLGEIGQRPRQPVDLVDDDHVDFPRADAGEQRPQGGPLHGTAGIAAIVELGRQADPSLVLLAGDIGCTGLALRIERIEVLFEPLLARFARVDRAAQASFRGYLSHRSLPRNCLVDRRGLASMIWRSSNRRTRDHSNGCR